MFFGLMDFSRRLVRINHTLERFTEGINEAYLPACFSSISSFSVVIVQSVRLQKPSLVVGSQETRSYTLSFSPSPKSRNGGVTQDKWGTKRGDGGDGEGTLILCPVQVG